MGKLENKRILIVDDEPELKELIADYFRSLKCQVTEAGGGLEAFKICETRVFDFVVTDLKMAKGNGLELLEKLHAKNANLPKVILVTGFAELTEAQARSKGALALIYKPFKFHQLQQLMESICENYPVQI